jgi:glycosyltransferase involved in cell wall biosynthesis
MKTVRVAHVATVDLTVRFLLLPQLRRLRDEGYDVTAISAPGPWLDDIEAEGIRFIPWTSATRAWDPRADVRAFRELLHILRRERFDLVHTHNPKPGVIGRIAARIAGTPCVVNTVHGLWAMPEDRLAKRVAVLGAEAVAARASDLELYQSEADVRWARRTWVVPRGRSRLLGNGTDVERFDRAAIDDAAVAAFRKELGLGDGLVVGTVGRLVAEKGYRELFEAATSVRRAHPDVRFLALGDPDPSKPDSISVDEIERAREHVVFA